MKKYLITTEAYEISKNVFGSYNLHIKANSNKEAKMKFRQKTGFQGKVYAQIVK